jgi:hypothetical protein
MTAEKPAALVDAVAVACGNYRTCEAFAIHRDTRRRWKRLAEEAEALHRELTAKPEALAA